MYIAPACIIKPEHLPHLKPLEQIDNLYYGEVSKDEAAKLLGIKSFDIGLPQHWVEYCIKKLGVDPISHVVWSYDTSRFGNPVGITREGRILVTILDHLSSPKAQMAHSLYSRMKTEGRWKDSSQSC